MRWTLGWRETNAMSADMKSCGPGIPMLMPSCLEMIRAATVAKQPVHRGDHDINVKTVARGMPDDRLNLWYLPPAFF
jgi:hypothetical protein